MTREQEILLKMAKKALSAESIQTDKISRVDAIDFVTKLIWNDGEIWNDVQDKIVDGINALPSVEAIQGWIPCSEKLPDNKTYVLTTIQVSGRQPHARSGFYHDGFFHNDNGDTWRATDREVRAWMPLPDPYREDGEDDGED